jgi:hypothetical protein
MELNNDIKKAYKKLKSDTYFNKMLSHIKDNIVEFELKDSIEEVLEEISNLLMGEEKDWEKKEKSILESIKIYRYPKKITCTPSLNSNNIIKTIVDSSEKINVKDINDIQFFIDIDIIGHVLGVLWILYVGRDIDKHFYEHSYGNRLLVKEKEEVTDSPHLFKPYFNEYESWRDKGLREAKTYHENDKDAMIIMLDIKRFYYSVNFTQEMMDSIFNEISKNKDNQYISILKRLNNFIYKIMQHYSEVYNSFIKQVKKDEQQQDKVILPIGFMPSNVLSNWYLDSFDKNVVNIINPIYYGRYVDDIIIVDKLEKNSKISEYLSKGNFDEVIKYYFIREKKILETKPRQSKEPNIINEKILNDNCLECKYGLNEKKVYYINFEDNDIRCNQTDRLEIQRDKLKIIYLDRKGTSSILDKFIDEIKNNSSEFRLLPDSITTLFSKYNDIYKLNQEDSINKLRGIKNFIVNKYELSKFIARQLTVSRIIDTTNNKFLEDIIKIYDNEVIINNYTTWENLFNLCLINKKDEYFQFIYNTIKKAIDSIDEEELESSTSKVKRLKETLENHLNISATRALTLIWGGAINKMIQKIFSTYSEQVFKKRKGYISSHMCNQSLIPIPINIFLDKNNVLLEDKKIQPLYKLDTGLMQLSKRFFDDSMKQICKGDTKKFLEIIFENKRYYPYIIKPEDIVKLIALIQIIKNDPIQPHFDNGEIVNRLYLKINYNINSKDINQVKSIEFPNKSETVDLYKPIKNKIITINKEIKDELRIAIATVNLKEKDFINVLKDNPNRSNHRYDELKEIINQAIKNKTDLLVLPENYIPFEWIHLLEREAKKANMAIISGVEHIKYGKKVNNLILSIFPYGKEEVNLYTSLRSKVFYSPEEKRQIRGYGLEYVEGKEYNLFVWNNIWIPVYCCYEITSISDRSLFYNLVDVYTIVEWNKDINYFSNIIEALSRDMHCYCLQVNSANYGDSCIIQPSKTEQKNIIRTKGGLNNTVLIGKINVKKLREFQIKSYELQKETGEFKPTPPQYNSEYVRYKLQNRLYEYLEENISNQK